MEYTEILIPLRKIIRQINLDSKRIQKEYDLSIPQLLALTFLKQCKDFQSTQKELREYLELNSSTVTGIVSRMEKKGLIARIPARGDKRSTWLSLTTQGLDKLNETPPLLQERLLAKLPDISPEKVKRIREGLSDLAELMGADHLDASPILITRPPE